MPVLVRESCRLNSILRWNWTTDETVNTILRATWEKDKLSIAFAIIAIEKNHATITVSVHLERAHRILNNTIHSRDRLAWRLPRNCDLAVVNDCTTCAIPASQAKLPALSKFAMFKRRRCASKGRAKSIMYDISTRKSRCASGKSFTGYRVRTSCMSTRID